MRDATLGRTVALIDMDPVDRAPQADALLRTALVLGGTTDSVVEDEDARGTGTGFIRQRILLT